MPKEMKIGALAGALKKRTQNSVDGQGRFHIWGSLISCAPVGNRRWAVYQPAAGCHPAPSASRP